MLIGYVRVSTEDQTVGQQTDVIHRYCELRGLPTPTIFEDPGVSGFFVPFAKRPGGSQVHALIEAGEVEHLVTARLDRLWRETTDAITTEARWSKLGVRLHFVDEGGCAFDTRSAMGRMMFTFRAAQAQFERDVTSERTTIKLRHRMSQGAHIGSAPYGYRRVVDAEGKMTALQPDPDEQIVLQEIATYRRAGYAHASIVRLLNERNIPTRAGKPWHRRTVQSILSRPEVNQ